MVDKLIRLLRKRLFRLVGSGSTRCQLVYAEDLAYALAETALGDGLDGAEFTCTYAKPIAMRELSLIAAEILQVPLPRPSVPILAARCVASVLETLGNIGLIKGEPLVTHEKIDMVTTDRAYDIARMRQLLHWEPPTDYREGIKRTVAALRTQ